MNFLSHAAAGNALEVIADALLDSALILPAVFLVHLLIAYLSRRGAGRHKRLLSGPLSPLIGTAAGIVPQCGFGIAATRLYTQKYISLGALVAVYIATSDEAIFVFVRHSAEAGKLIPLLIIKTIYAIAAGYFVNFFFRKKDKNCALTAESCGCDCGCHGENSEEKSENTDKLNHGGCCNHGGGKLDAYLWHPLKHSLIIFGYCLAINIVIGLIIFGVTPARIEDFMQSVGLFQPFFASLVGLIPNCASSIVIAEMYAEGLLTLGAAVAGLSVGAGLSYAVLIKENKNRKESLLIIASLFVAGILLGTFVDIFISIL